MFTFYLLGNTLINLISLFGGFCFRCSGSSFGLVARFEVTPVRPALVVEPPASMEYSLVKHGVAALNCRL